jgi:hypothetical protein
MHHPEKSKRQPSRYSKKWLFIIGCVGLLCLGLFGLLKSRMLYLTCFGTLFPSHADVEKAAFFKLPASAKSMDYKFFKIDPPSYREGCAFWVRFEIDPGDLEALQKSTFVETFEPTQLEGYRLPYFKLKEDWVLPANALAGFGYSNNFPIGQWIFVDTTDPSKLIVYIIANREILDL